MTTSSNQPLLWAVPKLSLTCMCLSDLYVLCHMCDSDFLFASPSGPLNLHGELWIGAVGGERKQLLVTSWLVMGPHFGVLPWSLAMEEATCWYLLGVLFWVRMETYTKENNALKDAGPITRS